MSLGKNDSVFFLLHLHKQKAKKEITEESGMMEGLMNVTESGKEGEEREEDV